MALETALRTQTDALRHRIDKASRSIRHLSPSKELRAAAERLREWQRRVICIGPTLIERARVRLRTAEARLDALSPLGILARGYAVAWKLPEERLVRSSRELSEGDELRLRFGKGAALVNVKQIDHDKPNR
jgi:exodeoxyribonuclease VII large subunit